MRGPRTGLHEMGLPYVSDPAISRHLAVFLAAPQPEAGGSRRTSPPGPAAILFNGGVFQPAALRERLVEVLHHWYDTPEHPWQPLVLTNPSLDLAVAWGAAHYAWLRHSGGRRIGGGIARSYYIGVENGEDGGRRSRTGTRTKTGSTRGDPKRDLDPRSSTSSPILAHRSVRGAAAPGGGAGNRPGEAGAGAGPGPAGDVPAVIPRRCAATTRPATC